MVSEKQKQYSRKWDRDNMRSVSCRLRTEEAELFKAYCTAHNTTPGAVLKNFVKGKLEEFLIEQNKQADNTNK